MRHMSLLATLLVLVIVSAVTNSMHYANASRIDNNYAHNPVTSLYKGTYKQVCGDHVCKPGETPKNP